ncbi:head GIN domain-containing protein [Massilia sp. LXY-6]|uniref:head GIN domain-containing protein n=1 Tax=Massilia sp. LXY-6 TaxID=3379823 RepID=UPI003EE0668B
MRALMKVGFGLLLLALLLIGASWSVLRAQGSSSGASPGSRLLATEKRTLGASIAEVEVSGPINLNLRQGTRASLEVRGEQRLLANVDTTVEGNTLHIGPRGILLRHRQPIEVNLVLPALEQLSISGTGQHMVSGFSGERIELAVDGSGGLRFNGRYRDIDAGLHGSGEAEITGGNADRVTADVKGTGHMILVGAARELHAEIAGSGELDARHLRAEVATLSHHGSGTSAVYASKHVNVELTGSGDVSVYGNPNNREVSRNGSGSVSFPD